MRSTSAFTGSVTFALYCLSAVKVSAEAEPTTAKFTRDEPDQACNIGAFHQSFEAYGESGSYCCPGLLVPPTVAERQGFCCVGANVTDKDVVPPCSTKVYITESAYTSDVEAAATQYSVTYLTRSTTGNATITSTGTIGAMTASQTSSTTSTGGGARATGCGLVGGAVLLAGPLLMQN